MTFVYSFVSVVWTFFLSGIHDFTFRREVNDSPCASLSTCYHFRGKDKLEVSLPAPVIVLVNSPPESWPSNPQVTWAYLLHSKQLKCKLVANTFSVPTLGDLL